MPTYTPSTGYQRAQELIAECIRTKSTVLDLGNLSLREVPPELRDCTWLKKLNLGDYFYYDKEDKEWVRGQGKNDYEDGGRNQLVRVPQAVGLLQQLETFSAGHNKIEIIDSLDQLVDLERLYLRSNQISE
ncbi:MAG: leucine-rich repeat domain-containing protein, partial [Lewinella sp.]|uniref:leucine-rich repeat domain-containing protein n=1 Tax=Lewinella sp. TaxID=2004506 RepID=UPI003D6B5CB9